MNKPPPDESPVSPYRMFVVQLRESSNLNADRWAGRVEHVTSGQASHFQSVEELLAFVAEVLASPAPIPNTNR